MSFKKTLWEASILKQYHEASIADVITTPPIETQGEKVIFSVTGAGKIKDYSGTIEYDDASTVDAELVFNKKKYFAIKMGDVEKAQTDLDVLTALTEEHSLAMAEAIDADVLAQGKTDAGKTLTNETINETNAYDSIVDMGTELSKNKVPKANRFVVVNAEILGLLAKDHRFTHNPVVLENGIVEGQKINGLQVVCSESLPENTILALHKSGLGYGKQLNEIEPLRLETSFSDAVRGLVSYGTKALNNKGIVALTYTIAPSVASASVMSAKATTKKTTKTEKTEE